MNSSHLTMAINTKHSELCHGSGSGSGVCRRGTKLLLTESNTPEWDQHWRLLPPPDNTLTCQVTRSDILKFQSLCPPISRCSVPVTCPWHLMMMTVILCSQGGPDLTIPLRPCKLLNGDFFLPQVMRIIVRDFLLKLGYYGNYFVTFYRVISNDHTQSKLY